MVSRTVIVVHGVGDPQPGDALSRLLNSFSVFTRSKIVAPPVAHYVDDGPRSGRSAEFLETFPVYQAHTRSGEGMNAQELRFIEVYWGDLSRVKGTIAGLLFGVVDLVFGLRHITSASKQDSLLAPCGFLTRIFRWLVNWTSSAALWIGRGPIVSLNILASIVVLMFIGSTLLEPAEEQYENTGAFGIGAGTLLCMALGGLLYRIARKRGWSPTTAEGMLLVGFLSFVGFGLTWMTAPKLITYQRAVEVVTTGLSIAASLMAASVLIMVAASVLAYVSSLFGSGQHGLDGHRAIRRSLTVIDVCTILSSAMLVVLLMGYWAVLADRLGDSVLADRIEQGLHLFGMVWLTLLAVAAVYLFIILWALRKEKSNDRSSYPRYIVHPIVVAVLLITGTVWPALFFPLIIDLECKAFLTSGICTWLLDSELFQRLLGIAHAIEGFNKYAIMASVVTASALVFVRAEIGTALDLVIDVISHFRVPEQAVIHKLRQKVVVSNTRGPSVVWPQRPAWASMVWRFKTVLEDALNSAACGPVTVLAHSQGTMIALEALGAITIARGEGDSSALRVSAGHHKNAITLVTMGCPLMHLYKHYLPDRYQINKREDSLLARWINIYRADDFVGREIGDTDFPTNLTVGPRGHTDYWSDRELLKALTDPASAILAS